MYMILLIVSDVFVMFVDIMIFFFGGFLFFVGGGVVLKIFCCIVGGSVEYSGIVFIGFIWFFRFCIFFFI